MVVVFWYKCKYPKNQNKKNKKIEREQIKRIRAFLRLQLVFNFETLLI